jgi:DNA-binding winged helix-turn-helix (wHTH) protein
VGEQAVKSHDGAIRFAEFTLDPANRQLFRDGSAVELGGRYFDGMVMLVRERGQLISKDRLHEEVWRGVPVTDEALSQAIMALRRALGDDAARPRFIETVPRHGYRFVGEVTGASASEQPPPAALAANERLRLIAGGVTGAAAAGLVVGLVYGSLAASAGPGSALSLVLVLICVSMLAALVSGLGIAGGIGWLSASERLEWWRPILGGALGGVAVGGFARLLGLDTLRLLTGSAPDRIAGAGEGLVIGLAVGLSYWLAVRSERSGAARYGTGVVLGGLGGLAITLAGGTLMAGSLAALVARFPSAGLSLAWASDARWLAAAGALEGALFTACLVAGMLAARR